MGASSCGFFLKHYAASLSSLLKGNIEGRSQKCDMDGFFPAETPPKHHPYSPLHPAEQIIF